MFYHIYSNYTQTLGEIIIYNSKRRQGSISWCMGGSGWGEGEVTRINSYKSHPICKKTAQKDFKNFVVSGKGTQLSMKEGRGWMGTYFTTLDILCI